MRGDVTGEAEVKVMPCPKAGACALEAGKGEEMDPSRVSRRSGALQTYFRFPISRTVGEEA